MEINTRLFQYVKSQNDQGIAETYELRNWRFVEVMEWRRIVARNVGFTSGNFWQLSEGHG